MAYNELIKNFEKVRAYMREFYVYGFKSRTEYDAKSARSMMMTRSGELVGRLHAVHADAGRKERFPVGR